jgi:putative transposase
MDSLTRCYKYKTKVNFTTNENALECLSLCRNLYNSLLEERILAYRMAGKSLSYFDQKKELVELKEYDERFKNFPSNIFQEVCDRLNKAYQNFFRRCKKGETPGFPQFKGRKFYNSFYLTYAGNWFIDGLSCMKIHKNKIIPEKGILEISKIGKFKLIGYDKYKPQGRINNVSMKYENGNWYAILFCDEIPFDEKDYSTGNDIGLDVGIASFLSDSNGNQIDNPRFFNESRKILKLEQRKLKNKKKFSGKWKKQISKIGKIHTNIKNQRLNFHRDIAKKIVLENDLIVTEKLIIKNMSKSSKGNSENHGSMVKQKSGLNRSILDAAWYQFNQILKNKSIEYGKTYIQVDPKYTSQTCNACGYVDKLNRESQSVFICKKCGHEENADVNGAKNILKKAIQKNSKIL